ncbi:MAG: hypothetical protein AVDCRST_MAG89-3143, partial [uncultured Gemmatimonadetes bacterium]
AAGPEGTDRKEPVRRAQDRARNAQEVPGRGRAPRRRGAGAGGKRGAADDPQLWPGRRKGLLQEPVAGGGPPGAPVPHPRGPRHGTGL